MASVALCYILGTRVLSVLGKNMVILAAYFSRKILHC